MTHILEVEWIMKIYCLRLESVQHLPPFLNWPHTYTGMGRYEIGRLAWNLRGVVAFYRTSLEPMKLVLSNRLIITECTKFPSISDHRKESSRKLGSRLRLTRSERILQTFLPAVQPRCFFMLGYWNVFSDQQHLYSVWRNEQWSQAKTPKEYFQRSAISDAIQFFRSHRATQLRKDACRCNMLRKVPYESWLSNKCKNLQQACSFSWTSIYGLAAAKKAWLYLTLQSTEGLSTPKKQVGCTWRHKTVTPSTSSSLRSIDQAKSAHRLCHSKTELWHTTLSMNSYISRTHRDTPELTVLDPKIFTRVSDSTVLIAKPQYQEFAPSDLMTEKSCSEKLCTLQGYSAPQRNLKRVQTTEFSQ